MLICVKSYGANMNDIDGAWLDKACARLGDVVIDPAMLARNPRPD
jgi:hypothetical protein